MYLKNTVYFSNPLVVRSSHPRYNNICLLCFRTEQVAFVFIQPKGSTVAMIQGHISGLWPSVHDTPQRILFSFLPVRPYTYPFFHLTIPPSTDSFSFTQPSNPPSVHPSFLPFIFQFSVSMFSPSSIDSFLFTQPSIHSVHPSIHPSSPPSVHPSIPPSVDSFFCASILSFRPSTHPQIQLSRNKA